MKKYFTQMSLFLSLCISLLASFAVQAQVNELVTGEHVDAQLVAQTTSAVPGETLLVALRLVHQEQWHTYWKNPGDAGKPTEITWTLPEGVSVSEFIWPTPQRIELPADLVDFGFENEIFLLAELSIPSSYSAETFELSGKAQWLECDDICIPGGADVSLSIPVSDVAQIDERWVEGFEKTLADQPVSDISLDAMFTILDGKINLLVQAVDPIFEKVADVTFIPGEHRVFDYISEQDVTYQLSSLQLSQGYHRRIADNLPEEVTGLLIVTDENDESSVFHINARPEGVNLAALADLSLSQESSYSLALVFLFALAGGFILNLMPCVFPVLSLKIISLVESRDSTRKEQRLHALTYTAGVILSFLALASILLALQASGAAVGWGFHLQQPWFVAVLIVVFFIMAISLSGIVEIGTSIMGVGSELSQQSGYRGSFFTGILASVVASPCTAPFMGVALGIAFTQPTVISLTIFAALGLGMALPFLLISFIPALANMMPKPGKWMLTFKHVMAIPLYLTVLWLLWVLQRQVGNEGAIIVAIATIIFGFAVWTRHKGRTDKAHIAAWRFGSISALISCVLALVFILQSPLMESRGLQLEGDGTYEVYSAARLAELRAEGQPVFVNMTASWCITCLVNERVALSSEVIMTAFDENQVTYLKGDWTNNDPAITEVLKTYETSGVPLYLMFPADPGAPAEVLPQILTEGIMLDALSRI